MSGEQVCSEPSTASPGRASESAGGSLITTVVKFVGQELLKVQTPLHDPVKTTTRGRYFSVEVESKVQLKAGEGAIVPRITSGTVGAEATLKTPVSKMTTEAEWSKKEGLSIAGGPEKEIVLYEGKPVVFPAGATIGVQPVKQEASLEVGASIGGKNGQVWSAHVKPALETTYDTGLKHETSTKITVSQDSEQVSNLFRDTSAATLLLATGYVFCKALRPWGSAVPKPTP